MKKFFEELSRRLREGGVESSNVEDVQQDVQHREDHEYRTNTEVITAVEVSGGQSDPDNPVTVRFHIDGTTYTVSNVYYPDGDSQLAWVRWTTPDEPQDMTIVSSRRESAHPLAVWLREFRPHRIPTKRYFGLDKGKQNEQL